MLRSFKVPAFLLLSLFAAACGDSGTTPPGTARFAGATADERANALFIADGMSTVTARSMVDLTDDDAHFWKCPSRAVDGDTAIYDAGEGCSTHDGDAYKGRVTAVNALVGMPNGPFHDPTKPGEIVFEAFERGPIDAPVAVDGTIRQTGLGADGRQRVETHLSMNMGSEAEIDLTIDCDGPPEVRHCTVAADSAAEIAGVGSFAIRGDLTFRYPGLDGWLEMEGVDLMRVEFKADEPCGLVTIDGMPDGELCTH